MIQILIYMTTTKFLRIKFTINLITEIPNTLGSYVYPTPSEKTLLGVYIKRLDILGQQSALPQYKKVLTGRDLHDIWVN